MIKWLASVFFGVLVCQSASAQTAILCTSQEQWTFAEDVGHPSSWAFNVSFDYVGQQLSRFDVGGLDCAELAGIKITEEIIAFTCSSEPTVFNISISRLSGEFNILREFGDYSHLNGVTIGTCQSGIRRF